MIEPRMLEKCLLPCRHDVISGDEGQDLSRLISCVAVN